MTTANVAAAAENAAAPAVDLEEGTRYFFESSWIWIQQNWLQILIAAGIATVIVLALTFVRNRAVRWFAKRENTITGWGTILAKAASRTNQFFIIMIAAKLVAGYAQTPDAVASTVNFLFTVAAVFQVAIWAREVILGFVEKRTQAENYHGEALLSALGLIRLLVSFAVFAIAFVVVLDNLGVNVTGLVAGLGVGGIAIGLAAQGIFADLFAALAIIFDRPFRRGDKISYDQTIGVVESIGLKSTRVRSFDGEERVIANKQLLEKEIHNITRRDHIRIKLPIGVAYETPPEKLEALPAILREIVEAQGDGITVARASFETFGASSIDFALWFDIAGDDWTPAHLARDAVIIGVVRRFAEEGISIPYPTQTTYTAAPDGRMIMPYPEVQPVRRVDKEPNEV